MHRIPPMAEIIRILQMKTIHRTLLILQAILPVPEIYLTTPVEELLLSLPVVEILQEYWEPLFPPEQVLPLQRWKTMEKS